ncbi:MAG: leucyl/phenylalanyl-tRNA--protein transferase [Gammaproteobacteria bacterium]|nr:leucyl/phenylalanyl-tRNA--protein transferase [Gammaproteobacteria bacterium]
MQPLIIPSYDQSMAFPDVESAMDEPNGLLAVGGDLSVTRLLMAYENGIFPWFSQDQPILWWSPDPRMVLFPENFHIPRSLKKTIRQNKFQLTFNTRFEQVMRACAQPRPTQPETWITDTMLRAYVKLHHEGFAHSFESWNNGNLVGGLYGVAIGKVFFGESMFSFETDASKIAFAHAVKLLTDWGYELIDCQVASEHLAKFGASNISRKEFIQLLKIKTHLSISESAWQSPLPTALSNGKFDEC